MNIVQQDSRGKWKTDITKHIYRSGKSLSAKTSFWEIERKFTKHKRKSICTKSNNNFFLMLSTLLSFVFYSVQFLLFFSINIKNKHSIANIVATTSWNFKGIARRAKKNVVQMTPRKMYIVYTKRKTQFFFFLLFQCWY